MTVSFDQARAIAERDGKAHYRQMFGDRGTFHVADWAFEDDDAFSMVIGARESIVDGEDGYTVFDAPSFLVDKATGELSAVNFLMNFARFSEMTPVGPVPAEHLISAEDL
ncbi:hypothetical protein [Rhodococcoides fascians]|uniref:hypothetical protein n=1 Tax=Rhodococcoides fascians TaxID=1828 RepID=UPI000522FFA5|nr:hypothetical protein [Rhodococcus fascians]